MEEILDQPTTPPQQPKKMPIGKAVLFNFGIMLAYMALTGVGQGEAGLGNMATDALLILAQVGLNLLVGLIMLFNEESRNLGAALLISGLIMGVIGFGACIGKVAVFG